MRRLEKTKLAILRNSRRLLQKAGPYFSNVNKTKRRKYTTSRFVGFPVNICETCAECKMLFGLDRCPFGLSFNLSDYFAYETI